MPHLVIEFIGLFLTGMLAGEEFVVRYGVRGPLAALDDPAHIRFRQGLIWTLRILVPAMFLPAFGVAIAAAVLDGAAAGIAYRLLGVAALTVWILTTLFGTVPINEAALDWSPDAPPANWTALVDRWERLNTVRTWAAVVAFGSLLTAVALRLSAN
ncbi:MAG TPA: DUF1772 domain-containing protein [Micromonosporaceae bacterium]